MSQFSLFLLPILIGATVALDCLQIPDSSVQPGHTVLIPDGATGPVPISPNFNCVYNIRVPPMVYAHVRLENQLKGGNDLITVRDAMAKRTLVSSSSRSSSVLNFYVFPNTTTTFQVVTKSVDVGSKFRMSVFYQKMISPVVSQISGKDGDLSYFLLNDLQVNSMKAPQNVQSQEMVVLTVGNSQFSADTFDNYFLVDGSFDANHGVYHLSDYTHRNFVSSGNNLTIVGLDNLVSESSVILSKLSDVQKFDDFTGITTYFEEKTTQIAAIGKKDSVTVISKDTDSVIITNVVYLSDKAKCSVIAVKPPVTPFSDVLLDFSTITSFPYTLNQKYFTLVVGDCQVAISMHSV